MKRTIIFIIGGLLLSGIIHIAIVFMVPYYADHDAWAEMHRFGRDGQFHVLPVPEPGAEPLATLDPRFVQAVCRFSLARGPVRIQAAFADEFWSVAVFDRRGRNIYSLNDRSADRARLDLVILDSCADGAGAPGPAGLARDGDRAGTADRCRLRVAEGICAR